MHGLQEIIKVSFESFSEDGGSLGSEAQETIIGCVGNIVELRFLVWGNAHGLKDETGGVRVFSIGFGLTAECPARCAGLRLRTWTTSAPSAALETTSG